nr:hypothetical protein [Leptotrichia sp. OH3620_COT-345]
MEAEFAVVSPGDFEAVKPITDNIENLVVTDLVRAVKNI